MGVNSSRPVQMDRNIVFNPNFNLGIRGWHSNSCSAYVLPSKNRESGSIIDGQFVCLITKRKQTWNGLEQDLTPQLQLNVTYGVTVMAMLPNASGTPIDIKATLRLENPNAPTKYVPIGIVKASNIEWSTLQGSFQLDQIPQKVIFYIEGAPAGIDILVKLVDIRPHAPSEVQKNVLMTKNNHCGFSEEKVEIVLMNPDFEDGLEYWYGKGCKLSLVDSSIFKEISKKYIAVATDRTSEWQGVEQDITGKLSAYKEYKVSAVVRIYGGMVSAHVLATLWTKNKAGEEQYITLAKALASPNGWVHLEGKMLLDHTPAKAAAYIEGPPAGIDLLIKRFSIFSFAKDPPIRPTIKNPQYGVNIVENSGFLNGLNGWNCLGPCIIELHSGGPLILPPVARESLGFSQPVSGIYIVAKLRTCDWEGPSQKITGKVQPFITYQVSAWVRISKNTVGPQLVNVALGVDGEWVSGGEVEADSFCWKEIVGSFRFETEPKDVLLYVQGPSANVDLMVANLMIFAVDRAARFEMLKLRTDRVRKRDAVVRVKGKNGILISNAVVDIKYRNHTFPLGSCINSYSLKRDYYLDFFLKNFNWAVFENEIKWGWTEKEKGKVTYTEADELCNLCIDHGILMRGHCIFWEAEDAVQLWVKELDSNELALAVQNRLSDVVSRFCGRFEHYDVNNEMLHGSFYKDRLGEAILPYMFKLVKQFDPKPKLFVNDYHVVDGLDAKSSPEKYIDQIKGLQEKGALVGGIGVQGHLTCPVGPIISNALDKLAMLGIPIWFTEVDVDSHNEFLRSDDLEVVLREAYAHPAVEGVLLWGFMETAMHRENAHLVDSDGRINEAGKTLIALRNEWQTSCNGTTDEMGCFKFRGYHGVYTVSMKDSSGKTIEGEFEVKSGNDILIVEVDMETRKVLCI